MPCMTKVSLIKESFNQQFFKSFRGQFMIIVVRSSGMTLKQYMRALYQIHRVVSREMRERERGRGEMRKPNAQAKGIPFPTRLYKLQQGPNFEFFLNSSTNLGLSIQTYEPMEWHFQSNKANTFHSLAFIVLQPYHSL